MRVCTPVGIRSFERRPYIGLGVYTDHVQGRLLHLPNVHISPSKFVNMVLKRGY